jgi:tetratricopeptide (TPR) repeat protein
VEEAIHCFQTASDLGPTFPNAHDSLCRALLQYGDFGKARDAFQRVVEVFPRSHPLSKNAAQGLVFCRQQLKLEQTLHAVLAGTHTPKDADERLALAAIAQRPAKQLYATAVQLYAEAFKAQPFLADDLSSGHRYNVACAAARAGTGQGKDVGKLDDTARAEMRYRAFGWLHDDLAVHTRQLAQGPDLAVQSRQALLYWQKDRDLATVRDPDALRKLPEAEQVAWRNLWAQVAALLARTRPTK